MQLRYRRWRLAAGAAIMHEDPGRQKEDAAMNGDSQSERQKWRLIQGAMTADMVLGLGIAAAGPALFENEALAFAGMVMAAAGLAGMAWARGKLRALDR